MPPKLSVVIPTSNRCERLRACLISLGQQTASFDDFEIVVVDRGSTDGTAAMLAELEITVALRVVTQPQSGLGAASNAGARESNGRYLLFVGDNVIASPGLVSAHLRAQEEHGPFVGIGYLDRRLPRNADRYARYLARERMAHYEHLVARPPGFQACFLGNFSVYRKSFEEVGGFALDLPVETDTELAFRLQENGSRLVYLPDAIATEDNRENWREIVQDAVRRGEASVELYRRHTSILPTVELGGEGTFSRRWRALRQIMLTLRFPPKVFVGVIRLLPGSIWNRPLFGFASDYAYWYGVRRAVPDRDMWLRLRRGTLILLYHAIGAPGEHASRYVVAGRRFARQMAWLRHTRCNVIPLEEYFRCQREHELPPARSVVITFDDGYDDNYRHAKPVLERLGFPATIFLVNSDERLNWWSDEGSPLAGRELMSVEQARSMIASGVIEIGSHTCTHPRLGSSNMVELEREIEGSRLALEKSLGTPVRFFAYPYGDTSSEVRSAVERAGYLGACTTDPGRNRPATDPFSLRRIEVFGTYSLVSFLALICFGRPLRSQRSR